MIGTDSADKNDSGRGPLAWIRIEILAWSDREHPDSVTLERWLEGHLPTGATEQEPYTWLLLALPHGVARVRPYDALARAAVHVINAVPERPPLTKPGAKKLYNLLKLCAGLGHPGFLFGPLFEMLRRNQVGGAYEQLDLKAALRGALARNQVDTTLSSVWMAMLAGKNDFLPGSERDGFSGIVRMPARDGQRTGPAFEDIATALDTMVHVLGADSGRPAKLNELLEEVRQVWLLSASHSFFSRLPHRKNWPPWAVETIAKPAAGPLPTLARVIPIDKHASYIAKGFLYVQDKLLNDHKLLEVDLRQVLDQIRPEYERQLERSPFASEASNDGVVLQAIMGLADRFRSKSPVISEALKQAALALKRESGLPTPYPNGESTG